ncbi:MAG: DUF2283 domain-containing protein [Microcystis aeruginosa Ma_QC_Ch_20071001_S25]|jgi:uncharacterized protein YuzE|uniref:DUF2283 domain-containing protein n=1 Tax=Microcystis aeruginosa Ma_QC_Ch_20071001_S25D TaxID=2486250 RepID=A0A552G1F3_MICAE|nr:MULTISPECIES: DUF2283 domain-containing protein [unclassified Microcystis]MCA2761404.1 DUF2283 domain-containing protein [Microcystis sp. M151S2]MCU7245591.1 DUF2283 domain-containing protein [Microcystis aeruginosa WS75]TRU52125.1 MAG: DUF2283 domain-containing protein [Microcystis aeruginosa Ma_QC_Ch_20071001_S25]TRU52727.1 MAG: DUF2283 domain-containing protein [Microcystis aeruginosa Ma_QC_Ch_20071001_S25D]TRU60998.1 MAG: DUF2283 domain-containing protein [Microcystis aeruginosa Ma_QC_C
MKINYYPETDSLYIHLTDKPSVDSQEIAEGVVADYDELGNLVGLDIDNASKKVQLGEFISNVGVKTLAYGRDS